MNTSIIKRNIFVLYACLGLMTSGSAVSMTGWSFKTCLKETVAKETRITPEGIEVFTKESGSRFQFSIDGSLPKVLKYGEKVVLPKGFSSAFFKSRSHKILLSAIGERGGLYKLSEYADSRSVGGKLKVSVILYKIVGDKAVTVKSLVGEAADDLLAAKARRKVGALVSLAQNPGLKLLSGFQSAGDSLDAANGGVSIHHVIKYLGAVDLQKLEIGHVNAYKKQELVEINVIKPINVVLEFEVKQGSRWLLKNLYTTKGHH